MKKREKEIRFVIIMIIVSLLFTGLAATVSQVMAEDDQFENIYKLSKAINQKVKPIKVGFVPLETSISVEDQKTIYKAAKEYNLDYALVMAVVQTESGGNSKSISATDDYGLMQINQCNHSWLRNKLGIDDFLDSKDNIEAGCFLLSRLVKHNEGNMSKALMAYNMGTGNASKLWSQGVYSTDYSKKVLELKEEYKKLLKTLDLR